MLPHKEIITKHTMKESYDRIRERGDEPPVSKYQLEEMNKDQEEEVNEWFETQYIYDRKHLGS